MSERMRSVAVALLLAAAIGLVIVARSQRASESVVATSPLARSHAESSMPEVLVGGSYLLYNA
jgi:hypothetical protein